MSSIVSKSAHILDTICESAAALTLSEISRRTALPKSSAHRILNVLLHERLVGLDSEHQTYHPGTRMTAWAARAFNIRDLPEKAHDLMVALHDRTRSPVMLSILDGAAVLFLKNVGGYDPYRQIPQVGEHCPIHACATGKVLVAFLPEDQRAEILSAVTLTRFTDHTVKSRAAFERELANVRKSGLGICDREDFLHYAAIAVPVYGPNQKIAAALSIWNIVERQDLEQLMTFRGDLEQAAGKLSLRVGGIQA